MTATQQGSYKLGLTAPAADATKKLVTAEFVSLFSLRGDVSQSWTAAYQTTARANLGLGSMATQAASAVAITGGTVAATVGAYPQQSTGISGNGQSNFCALPPATAQGQLTGYSVWATFQNTPGDNGARRAADIVAGFDSGNWGTEYLSLRVGSDASGAPASNDAAALTTERVRVTRAGLRCLMTIPAGDSSTLMPTTAWVSQNFAAATVPATAGAALTVNTLVSSSGGMSNPSLTTADNTTAAAAGFVLAASASGAPATLVRAGPLGGFSGLTPGAVYYLGTSGGVAAAPPMVSGTVIQSIGIATSATTIDVRLGEPETNE